MTKWPRPCELRSALSSIVGSELYAQVSDRGKERRREEGLDPSSKSGNYPMLTESPSIVSVGSPLVFSAYDLIIVWTFIA